MRLLTWSVALWASAALPQDAPRTFVNRYCLVCHNHTLRTAGLAFEELPVIEAASGTTDAGATWEHILRKVRTSEMPPPVVPKPDNQSRNAFVAAVQDALDESAALHPDPGRSVVHRLNRVEYGNAVRDLLGLQVDIDSLLPPDDSGYGFDNIGDVLSVSPAFLERCLAAARHISKLALEDAVARRKLLTCEPAPTSANLSCAKAILGSLARHAYRRPIADSDLKPLLVFYASGRRHGGFAAGIEAALRAVLVSPEFLFHIETDPPGSPSVHRVSDLELASRLSFFLWSSIPDDELLNLAAQCRLSDPGELEHQVRRMLADSRSDALVKNFATQWLALSNLRFAGPNPRLFPEFDDGLRQLFRRETELFIEDIFREDRSVTDLWAANFSFLNERLARHYGIDGVQGDEFRRVDFADNRRGGLLGQGSILTVTSYATRTSVVLRGKWILENILGAPPPPPPPDIPSLPQPEKDQEMLAVRRQMERHRSQAACASCHAVMDPLGFALDNYDAVGKWRTEEAGSLIDASARLPDGTEFEGPAGLKAALWDRRQEFVATFTTKLLTFALGRGLEWYDQPTIRAIDRKAARDEFRFSSIVLGIVGSTPFQMRRSN
ncbi:MAG TPA: DUF1592 domain-containing protein [Bryobacteraceae bacterium]|nr:DUF1592 domain-containing protein [Bryobacteraceae bacterium]